MTRFHRIGKIVALAGCGGIFWMWGAGSCLPYNFYSSLLGDTIIATAASTIVGALAGSVVAAE